MKLFVPFFHNQKAMNKFLKYLHHNMKNYHVSQQLCPFSTDSVTDHDNPVVKSIVIHTNPKYHLLIHKVHPKKQKKQYIIRHFSSLKSLISTQNLIMKNYSFQKPCYFWKWTNQWRRMPSVWEASTWGDGAFNSDVYSSWNMDEGASPREWRGSHLCLSA